MKRIASQLILVVILCGHTYANQPDKSKEHEQKRESIVQAPISLRQPDAKAQNAKGQDKPHQSEREKVIFLLFGEPGYYKAVSPETWSNWALVIAAIIAAWAALKTLWTIRRQVDLQHIAMEQWIGIDKWTSKLSRDSRNLCIGFRVRNYSALPLIVKTGWINIAIDEVRTHHFRPDECRISPNIPKIVTLDAWITNEERKWFLGNEGVTFNVSGDIVHTSVGPLALIPFHMKGRLWCNKLKTVFEEEVMVAKVQS